MKGSFLRVLGQVVRGHGVASGQAEDPRFVGGTLAMQAPHFAERGLDLTAFYPGTLNVSIAPKRFLVLNPRFRFEEVKWAAREPAENFWFLDCRVGLSLEDFQPGMIYYPDPETKPCHFQPPNVLEILAPEISGIEYGDPIWLELQRDQIEIQD